MTSFQIMSDIHQEFVREPIISELDLQADYLLLAGDITNTPQNLEYMRNFSTKVIYIMGNHEYYGRHWETALARHKKFFKDSSVHVAEKEVIRVKNVRIICTTLWTDFWAPTLSGKEHHGGNCFRGMADLSVIKGFSLQTWEDEHKKCLDYIRHALKNKHNGPTIVMTHHAPSFKSSHPKWENSSIKGGFCSDLDYIIKEYQPDCWIHGHCHESFNYNIGFTRVLCNPYGYRGQNPDFKNNLIIEV